MPKLSERLSVIAALVPFGARVCDIGTDHGYLSIELIKNGKAKSVIAADIGEKPLKNAEKNIKNNSVDNIELRLSDGFDKISAEEFDTAVIVGIGGEVIAGILKRGILKLKKNNKTLILQPTTSPEFLRKFLFENGFEITEELPIFENNKVYSAMKVLYTGASASAEVGLTFVGRLSPITNAGKLYIEKQYKRCKKCADAMKNIKEKAEEYEYYSSAAEYIEKILKNGENNGI